MGQSLDQRPRETLEVSLGLSFSKPSDTDLKVHGAEYTSPGGQQGHVRVAWLPGLTFALRRTAEWQPPAWQLGRSGRRLTVRLCAQKSVTFPHSWPRLSQG